MPSTSIAFQFESAINHVRYDKFLAIHNELRGIGSEEATAPSGESEPVDTVV